MTTFLTNIVAAVFRPSVAAMSIAMAVAIITVDGTSHSISAGTVDITDLSCSGLFKPVCQLTK
ncbi:hypothetical protein [uncultured Litoreibacter sp.]|uniref:hypothetical protein n=1 Tax=uncultured Litoreibacter sp. TaxID=1392394 RepID=UPI00261BCE5C|nr:hypothetical protein [uncultured Litoreibacter sp.]